MHPQPNATNFNSWLHAMGKAPMERKAHTHRSRTRRVMYSRGILGSCCEIMHFNPAQFKGQGHETGKGRSGHAETEAMTTSGTTEDFANNQTRECARNAGLCDPSIHTTSNAEGVQNEWQHSDDGEAARAGTQAPRAKNSHKQPAQPRAVWTHLSATSGSGDCRHW